MNPFDLLCLRRSFKHSLDEQRRRMYRVAYSWCQDASLADDLVQEALTKAYRNLHQLREVRAMNKWMFDIMTNCWRDHLRRRKPVEDIEALSEQDTPCHTDSHETDQISALVRRAVWQLPDKHKEVLALIDLAGFSYTETAEILKVPIGTVTSRLARGRDALRDKLRHIHNEAKEVSGTNIVLLKEVQQLKTMWK